MDCALLSYALLTVMKTLRMAVQLIAKFLIEEDFQLPDMRRVIILRNQLSDKKSKVGIAIRMMKSSVHTEEDDFVPELQRSIHPRERPDWEETLSAMESFRITYLAGKEGEYGCQLWEGGERE
ncbi:Rho GTPase-activating protein 32 [Chelonia mydas]|uniref:Rho GTPase-activating protein 32 n=1 Tax=Chelonia mydas TaxID=8469 RepID=M7AWV8_CHEMY|nr:Rho GTPase-activating protein 32 [Chelonia mydas]